MHRNQMEKAYASNSPAHLRNYQLPFDVWRNNQKSVDGRIFDEYLDSDIFLANEAQSK